MILMTPKKNWFEGELLSLSQPESQCQPSQRQCLPQHEFPPGLENIQKIRPLTSSYGRWKGFPWRCEKWSKLRRTSLFFWKIEVKRVFLMGWELLVFLQHVSLKRLSYARRMWNKPGCLSLTWLFQGALWDNPCRSCLPRASSSQLKFLAIRFSRESRGRGTCQLCHARNLLYSETGQ